MKTELAQKLKEVLDNMTQEQFDQEWSAITALNLEGPSFVDVVEYFAVMQAQLGSYDLKTPQPVGYNAGENNYALAA